MIKKRVNYKYLSPSTIPAAIATPPAGMANFKVTLELAIAKENLKKTDEVFIACAEATALGLPSPYSQEYLEEVGAKRQALRDRITELEG